MALDQRFSTLLRALSDRTRLRLINLIGDDEVCVCFLVAVLGTNQPKISRHLAYLRRAGLVSARRQGKWMHYRLTQPRGVPAREVFGAVRKGLAEDAAMRRDRAHLVKLCCDPGLLVQLGDAPVPKGMNADVSG
jgi:ArsR family transcriptional regulator